MTVKPDGTKSSPEAQLRSFVDKFDPKEQKRFLSIRAAVRKRFPSANEVAYAYTDSVVIAYSPTARGIDAVVSIAARADGVRLYLMHGPQLPDPKKLLMGTGKQVRFVELEAASKLEDPDVEALIVAAVDRATVPMPAKGGRQLIIKSSAARKRPRRKPAK